MAVCEVWQLGRVPYQQAWDLQNRLVEERARANAPDRLLLLEHPHVYTLGSSGRDEHLLMPPEERERLGVDVLRVDRGGDITYHGPGQLVGYPIVQLPRSQHDGLRADFVGYVRSLETVVIRALADFGIAAQAIPGLTIIWVAAPSGSQNLRHRRAHQRAVAKRLRAQR
jgi:lipoyl(octanoyl) transferase